MGAGQIVLGFPEAVELGALVLLEQAHSDALRNLRFSGETTALPPHRHRIPAAGFLVSLHIARSKPGASQLRRKNRGGRVREAAGR